VQDGRFREDFFGRNLVHFDGVNLGLELGQLGCQCAFLVFKRAVQLSEALRGDLVGLVNLVGFPHLGTDFFKLPVVCLKPVLSVN
jgi:hypothetical protein